jgi:Ala-tRNA(Pro) deacylase
MVPESIRMYLQERGIYFDVVPHPPAPTAQETAQETGLTGWKLVKTVAVRVDGIPWVCAVAAPMVVDLDAVCDALNGKECELCHESELHDLFPGCEVGAAPPFGRLYQMGTIYDRAIEGTNPLYVNGGTHTDLIALSWEDFEKLEEPHVATFAAMPGEAWKHALPVGPEPHSWHS